MQQKADTVVKPPGLSSPCTMGFQEQRPENVRLGNTERPLAIHFVVKTTAESYSHQRGNGRMMYGCMGVTIIGWPKTPRICFETGIDFPRITHTPCAWQKSNDFDHVTIVHLPLHAPGTPTCSLHSVQGEDTMGPLCMHTIQVFKSRAAVPWECSNDCSNFP